MRCALAAKRSSRPNRPRHQLLVTLARLASLVVLVAIVITMAACPAGNRGPAGSASRAAGLASFSVNVSATGHSSVRGIVPAPGGGAYIAGSFEGSLSLPNTAALVAQGKSDGFVAKVGPRGETRWALSFGGPNTDTVTSLAGHGSTGIALAGLVGHGAMLKSTALTAPGHPASFVSRIDGAGKLLWSRPVGSTDYAIVTGIALGPTGGVVAVGNFAGTLRFGQTVLTSGGAQDAFVLKFSSDGSPAWAKRAGGPFPDFAQDVALHRGRIAIVGGFGVRADFGARIIASRGSSLDAFIAVYEHDGSLAWVRRGGGQGRDTGYQVAFDNGGRVYAAGSFMGAGRFGGKELSAADESDVFLVSLGPLGLHRWSRRLGGKGIDTSGGLSVEGNRVVLGGSFAGLGLFGNRELDTKGKHDIFIATYSVDGTALSAIRYGSRGDESVAAIALLVNGDALVAGSYTGAPVIGGAAFDANGPVAGFVVRLTRVGKPASGQK